MASIVLSAVGTSVGSAIGGPVGGFIGGKIGGFAGGFIDGKLFGGNRKLKDTSGPRLSELGVQASTYGKMIPIVYGSIRIAGNVIWSRPIKETVTTTTTSTSSGGGGKGGGGGKVSQSSSTYTYSASLAIAICEGEINDVVRVWADAKQLDFSQITIRVYKGSETQLPDSYIQAFEGGNTPAYRGLAYVVIEDFELADYGNRIPNFTFEVKRKVQSADYDGEITEHMLKAITLIPGAGEFVYDTHVQFKVPGSEVDSTWVQDGSKYPLNMHNVTGQANVKLSLDQLAETFPNIEWVSVVAAWFGDSLDAGTCVVKPGVEYQVGGQTEPGTWSVGGFTRDTARLITQVDGSPVYGGTPDDASLIRLITELKDRGYNVMLYPMLFMDVTGKPWRGELTGSSADVASFFTKTNGFNSFINHYAALGVTAGVDAFIIGSEMVGLTQVTDTPGNYPAVNALVSLAATVKATVGSGIKITYAADWSEYHHDSLGWYNLDPLWASANIDMVGIDAYFPIKDSSTNSYDVDALRAGWTSGEGVDYYYTDSSRTTTAPLTDAYAWKNLAWFWSNSHTNPDASTSAWVPESKKIWFTEFGFPSVDNAANQPNVFYDPSTSDSGYPYLSRGRVDFSAQRAATTATLHEWHGSDMVEQLFLWTWDARPYPYWPDLTNLWTDGASWKTGHWVQGKFGTSSLNAILRDLCLRSGLDEDFFDTTHMADQVEGYVIVSPATIRNCIEQLEQTYLFDSAETDYILTFLPRGEAAETLIDRDDLAVSTEQRGDVLEIQRLQEIMLPKRVNVIYLNRLSNYQPSTQYAERAYTESLNIQSLDIPVVISDQYARNLADITLYTRWVERHSYSFLLPIQFATLEPASVVRVDMHDALHDIRIKKIKLMSKNMLMVQGLAEDQAAYDFYSAPSETGSTGLENQAVSDTDIELLDLPALPNDDIYVPKLRVAARGVSDVWRGAVLFRSDDNGANYERALDVPRGATLGTTIDVLADGVTNRFDEASSVTVQLIGDAELSSITEIAMLNGANAAMVGDELIQFQNAQLLAPGKYKLSRLLRGRLGTDFAMATHSSLERFVLLDSGIIGQTMSLTLLNLPRLYKAVSVGGSLVNTASFSHTYRANCLRPYSPVHLKTLLQTSGDIDLTWVRRTRGQGAWQDGVDVPLNEDLEQYEVNVLYAGNLVRTLNATSPYIAYTLADQTADFGAPADDITFRVHQLSAQVGRGYAAELFYSV